MVKIERDPAVDREIELSIGDRVVHNSFYLPRYKTRSKLYKGYETYEGFGYGLSDTANTRSKEEVSHHDEDDGG